MTKIDVRTCGVLWTGHLALLPPLVQLLGCCLGLHPPLQSGGRMSQTLLTSFFPARKRVDVEEVKVKKRKREVEEDEEENDEGSISLFLDDEEEDEGIADRSMGDLITQLVRGKEDMAHQAPEEEAERERVEGKVVEGEVEGEAPGEECAEAAPAPQGPGRGQR